MFITCSDNQIKLKRRKCKKCCKKKQNVIFTLKNLSLGGELVPLARTGDNLSQIKCEFFLYSFSTKLT